MWNFRNRECIFGIEAKRAAWRNRNHWGEQKRLKSKSQAQSISIVEVMIGGGLHAIAMHQRPQRCSHNPLGGEDNGFISSHWKKFSAILTISFRFHWTGLLIWTCSLGLLFSFPIAFYSMSLKLFFVVPLRILSTWNCDLPFFYHISSWMKVDIHSVCQWNENVTCLRFNSEGSEITWNQNWSPFWFARSGKFLFEIIEKPGLRILNC